MSAVDFEQWAVPNLSLPFGDRTFTVRPPSVEEAKQVLAAAALGEVRFGLVAGPVPDEIVRVLETIGDTHPALGADAYAEMVGARVPSPTIDRMSVYATFYWARGRAYADTLARVLWTPRDADYVGGDGPPPKD